ncbi:carboxylesterase family protein [Caulobacter sp. BK020]|uniref:carboxylesterase/lipase family protein n=1 Tax=Caulobacter sp. BK020 TaxID=2512117 RepID=UPI001050EA81|nr:carboxylesterase family protein [Caulobacter sp. BK020]
MATMLFRMAMAAICAVVLGWSGAAEARAADTVRVDGGLIAGAAADGVRTFFGVPYAAPPVGDLRWRAPQPVKPWDGVRSATAFSPVCRQTAPWITEPQSEDCLYLNIWAPAAPSSAKRPVMVWIHGGGFFGGSGSQALYDGTRLARRDVIVVTLNYRLGVLGFFSHPDLTAESPDHVSGNQGILDQIAALRWIHDNIAAVGGDPDRVTIMGESAGGESVAILVASPLAKGLFQRAISESGNYGLPLDPAEARQFDKTEAEAAGAAFARAEGASGIAALRALPADQLLRAAWSPRTVVEGHLLREDLTTLYRTGRQNRVPILVGWNADEGKDLAPEIFATSQFTAERHAALLEGLLHRTPSAAMLAKYPARTDAEARASIDQFTTDYWGWRIWFWARLQAAGASDKAYVYHFVHSPTEPLEPCGYGCKAGHGAEIRYVFDQLQQDARPWGADDRLLADQIAGYWTNFAKSGDPNGAGLPRWTPFDGSDRTIHRLGTPAEAVERGPVDFDVFEP